ncbi:ubiquinol-cytochrome c reductase iron-sulfur subunit domain protein, partial [Mycobacterium tuberculosis variant bovis]
MPGPNPQDGAKDGAKATAVPREPDEAALAAMSNQELLALGGKLDGVRIAYKEPRWPVEGTKAEKRAERSVAVWVFLGSVFGLALFLIFLFLAWGF